MMRPWQHLPNIRRWHFRFLKLTFRDTLAFFWQQMLVGVVVAIVAAFFEQPGTAALLGLKLNFGILLVSFILNAVRAPVKLDNHREIRADLLRKSARRRIASRDVEIKRLKSPTARSSADQYHFDILNSAINASGGEDAKGVLRCLHSQGQISIRVNEAQGLFSSNALLPSGMKSDQAYGILARLKSHGVVTCARGIGQIGHDETFEIAKGFASIVEELIYPEISPRSVSLAPLERENWNRVGDLLRDASKDEREVLKCILNRGVVEATQLQKIIPDRDLISRSLEKWLHSLIEEHVEHGTNRTSYSIVSGLRDALQHLVTTD